MNKKIDPVAFECSYSALKEWLDHTMDDMPKEKIIKGFNKATQEHTTYCACSACTCTQDLIAGYSACGDGNQKRALALATDVILSGISLFLYAGTLSSGEQHEELSRPESASSLDKQDNPDVQ